MITLPQRTLPNTEHLHKLAEGLGADIRVALPGVIKSFDAVKGTAVIQLTIREKVTIDGVEKDVSIPELPDVPLVMPRGGGFMLSLPIAVNDEVLVVFADCCHDGWWQSGGVQNQMDNRRHDLSDAFFIPGPWSQKRKVSNHSTSAIELRTEDGNTKVSVSNGSITLSAGGHGIVINSSGVSIDGKLFLPHTHTGVQTGSGNTGGVA